MNKLKAKLIRAKFLHNPKVMVEIEAGLKAVREGRGQSWSQVKKELLIE